jgi:hypothetical protein
MLGAVPARVRDAETYLRELGEELLVADRNPFTFERLPRVAEILEVAGVLEADVAARVVAEYATAVRLRGDAWRRPAQAAVAVPLAHLRVVTGPWELSAASPPIVVERVQLAEDRFTFEAHGFLAPGGPSHPRPAGASGSPVPASFAVADATGTRATATSAGGGWSSHTWESRFESSTPLALTTAWVEIAGQRIDFPPARDTTATAWVEDLPTEQDAALGALWHALAGDVVARHRLERRATEDAVEALIATGARVSDDPALAQLRWASAAISGAGGRPGPLPPPWSAWLRRRSRGDGPAGRLSLAVRLEDVDSTNLRFDALASSEEGFSLRLAASPGSEILSHPGMRRRLVFWAEDDRGNVYLGGPGNSSGSAEMAEGEVEFTGPLDPAARLLRLLPTGRRRRGVVEIPLDDLIASR